MPSKKNTSEISVGYWMLALLITALPIINLILVPLFAFTGSNQTKKNFFRAILAWLALIICVHLAILFTISWPKLLDTVKGYLA